MSNARLKRKLRSLEKRGLLRVTTPAPVRRKRGGLWHQFLTMVLGIFNKPEPIPGAEPKPNLRPLETVDPRNFIPKERTRVKRG